LCHGGGRGGQYSQSECEFVSMHTATKS
jgi:hypothetical protein